ncbi:MAG TPA: YsnF/AvaK domain-containing protein [Herpetosiphonaceae bacterium]
MAKNVVGLFDNMSDAEAAVRDLRDAGFPSGDISFVANNADNRYSMDNTSYTTADDTEAAEGAGIGATGGAVLGGLAGLLVGLGALAIPGIGPVVAAGTLATALGTTAVGAGIGAAAGGLVGALVGAGIPEEDAHVYAEGIRRGGALVAVQVATDDEANRAADIMDRHNVVDIDERGSTYRQSGWSRFDESATPYTDFDRSRTAGTAYGSTTNVSGTDFDTTRTGYSSTNLEHGGEAKIPIIEEELRIGKREVEGGGVRVNTRIEETPVNEQVTLREERVDVHRKPVDRPVSDADLANLQEGTFEVRERSEEAIVDKQARVVEEVHLRKDVEEHTENIQDTVRRTDVDVDQISSERTVGYTDTDRTTTGFNRTGTDEGAIERGASKLGNAAERGLGADLDRDGDVGQRDPRNNF